MSYVNFKVLEGVGKFHRFPMIKTDKMFIVNISRIMDILHLIIYC